MLPSEAGRRAALLRVLKGGRVRRAPRQYAIGAALETAWRPGWFSLAARNPEALSQVLLRDCGVVVHFFLGKPDVYLLLGLGQDARGVHQVRHRHAVRVRVGPAHMREVAPDGAWRCLVGIGRARHLADAGN